MKENELKILFTSAIKRVRKKKRDTQHFPFIMNAFCIYKIKSHRKVNIAYVKMSITLKYFNEAIICATKNKLLASKKDRWKIKKKRWKTERWLKFSKRQRVDLVKVKMVYICECVSERVSECVYCKGKKNEFFFSCSSNKHYIVIDDDHRIVVIFSLVEWVFVHWIFSVCYFGYISIA